jgi:hypothetical protein
MLHFYRLLRRPRNSRYRGKRLAIDKWIKPLLVHAFKTSQKNLLSLSFRPEANATAFLDFRSAGPLDWIGQILYRPLPEVRMPYGHLCGAGPDFVLVRFSYLYVLTLCSVICQDVLALACSSIPNAVTKAKRELCNFQWCSSVSMALEDKGIMTLFQKVQFQSGSSVEICCDILVGSLFPTSFSGR